MQSVQFKMIILSTMWVASVNPDILLMKIIMSVDTVELFMVFVLCL